MKKPITLIILSATVLLTSCQKEIPIIDSVQSNTGSGLFNEVMETNIGYYYNNSSFGNSLSLHYFDKDTGITIYLCSKPECAHDGNSFCPATNNSVIPFNTMFYGGSIYITGRDIENLDTLCLFRASPDGTELTKLVDLIKLSSGFASMFVGEKVSSIIHRGKAFIPYHTQTSKDGDNYSGNSDSKGFGGIVMVDLQSLKHEIIDETEPVLGTEINPTDLKADGDYVYYLIKSIKNYTIKRYSITEKTTEEFQISKKITSYSIIGDEIWYCYEQNYNAVIEIYNMKTGETRESDVKLIIPDFYKITDGEGNTEFYDATFYMSEILYDGKYLYASNGRYLKSVGEKGGVTEIPFVNIYSLDGTRLAEFPYDYKGMGCSINVLNGKVYLQTGRELLSCPVIDIIEGKFEWKVELEFRDIKSIDE